MVLMGGEASEYHKYFKGEYLQFYGEGATRDEQISWGGGGDASGASENLWVKGGGGASGRL